MSNITAHGFDIESPPAPIVAFSSGPGGAVPIGSTYKVSYVTHFGETLCGVASAASTSAAVKLTVPVRAIGNVIGRKIYRSSGGPYTLLTAINDNRTTLYVDLAAAAPGPVEPDASFASSVEIERGWVVNTRAQIAARKDVVATAPYTEIDQYTQYAFVTTTAPLQGVLLPPTNAPFTIGMVLTIVNQGPDAINMFPRPGQTINGSGGVALLPAGVTITFVWGNSGDWTQSDGSGGGGAPTGPAGGSLTGSYPNPTLAATGTPSGTFGSATDIPVVDVALDGRITNIITVPISSLNPDVLDNAASPAYPTQPHVDGVWYGENAKARTGAASTTVVGNIAAGAALTQATVIGSGHVAVNNSTALGRGCTTTAASALAVGTTATAGGNSTALGLNASANNFNGVAVGANAAANAQAAVAIGNAASASIINAVAIGNSSSASATATIAVGLNANASFANSTALGAAALANNAIQTTSVGASSSTVGQDSTALGYIAAGVAANSTAVGSTSVAAGDAVAIGKSSNANTEAVAIGHNANASGASAIAVGRDASAVGGSIAIGHTAIVGGARTIAIGTSVNTNTTTDSVFIGDGAGISTQNTSFTTAVGQNALNSTTTGLYNTAFGAQSLNDNVTGNYNVAMGLQAGFRTNGNNNTAVGGNAYFGAVGASGSDNTAIGQETLYFATSASQNVSIGSMATNSGTTGSENVHVGYRAGFTGNHTRNVCVGALSDTTGGVTNAVVLGYNITGSVTGGLYSTHRNNITPTSARVSVWDDSTNENVGLSFPASDGQVLSSTTGGALSWITPSGGGVTTFQTSLSGLSPSIATSGPVTLSGTLAETSGGTNQTTYATGDLLYASGANTLSKRAIGSTGQILTVVGGVPTWSTQPQEYHASVRWSGSPALTGGGTIPWDTEIVNNEGIYNAGLSAMVIPRAGVYVFTFSMHWQGVTGTQVGFELVEENPASPGVFQYRSLLSFGVGSTDFVQTASITVRTVAGYRFTVRNAYSLSGTYLDFITHKPYFTCTGISYR